VTEPSHAVFLSYASQDAEPAQRICASLRAAGIEVWLDQSELRGGEAWDRRIRKEIHDCSLFIPVISANAHARVEGYFRLEWKLAVDRSHYMAPDLAFLLPVVIDDTPQTDQRIPDRFRELQWTCLPAGQTTPVFVERVRRLLSPMQPDSLLSIRRVTDLGTAATPTPTLTTRLFAPSRRALLLTSAVAVAAAVAYFAIDKLWISKHPPSSAPATVTAGAVIPTTHSIAVLPFADMSEKHDQEYFADGLTEELIDLLTQLSELRVAAQTSTFYFKTHPATVLEIAKTLRVAYVLEGSVRRAGNTLRVTAQLVHADDGFHLWSKSFDRPARDIFKVQDEIANAVVSGLQVNLGSGQQLRNAHHTNSQEAYEQFLIGQRDFNAASRETVQRAIGAFEKAIQSDPGYAAAYAGLAAALDNLGNYGTDQWPTHASLARSISLADKAIQLDPDLADGYSIRGVEELEGLDWIRAEADLEKAITLEPRNTQARRRHSYFLSTQGRYPEAIAEVRAGLAFDPLDAFSLNTLCNNLVAAGRLPEAEAAARQMLELDPHSEVGIGALAPILILQGKPDEAARLAERATDEGNRLLILAVTDYLLGRRTDAERALETYKHRYAARSWESVAITYALRREYATALDNLDEAYRRSPYDLSYVKPDFAPFPAITTNPRFKALLRKLNLPE
jgi:TolB-like protein/tetratricopeptide (TPR) repeat protein